MSLADDPWDRAEDAALKSLESFNSESNNAAGQVSSHKDTDEASGVVNPAPAAPSEKNSE